MEQLVHNLEHGYTIVWYDDTIKGAAARGPEGPRQRARTEDADGTAGKFIVTAWDDAVRRRSRAASTSASRTGAPRDAATSSCAARSAARRRGVHQGVPVQRLARAERRLTPQHPAAIRTPQRLARGGVSALGDRPAGEAGSRIRCWTDGPVRDTSRTRAHGRRAARCPRPPGAVAHDGPVEHRTPAPTARRGRRPSRGPTRRHPTTAPSSSTLPSTVAPAPIRRPRADRRPATHHGVVGHGRAGQHAATPRPGPGSGRRLPGRRAPGRTSRGRRPPACRGRASTPGRRRPSTSAPAPAGPGTSPARPRPTRSGRDRVDHRAPEDVAAGVDPVGDRLGPSSPGTRSPGRRRRTARSRTAARPRPR